MSTAAGKKIAIVTGSALGLGYELARQLIGKGWFVAGIDFNTARQEELSRTFGADEYRAFVGDISDEAFVKDSVAAIKEIGHIDLLIRDTGVTPAVSQVELHPYFQQREQLAYDNAHGIITEAWSPLGRANQMLRDPDLKRIAAKHGISVVQAILRWHLQYGDVAIPKSLNPERQRQNLDLTAFELDDQDMADIAAMDNPEGHTFGQNPHWHEEA